MENLAKQWVFEGRQFDGVTEICHRLALVATVTKICDSTSNNEIIVLLYNLQQKDWTDTYSVRQNIAYLVDFTIESAYATFYQSVIVTLLLPCTFPEILQVFVLMT